jgi:hypothetical protein
MSGWFGSRGRNAGHFEAVKGIGDVWLREIPP